MKHLDGPTTGPQGFAGVIGSAPTKCELCRCAPSIPSAVNFKS